MNEIVSITPTLNTKYFATLHGSCNSIPDINFVCFDLATAIISDYVPARVELLTFKNWAFGFQQIELLFLMPGGTMGNSTFMTGSIHSNGILSVDNELKNLNQVRIVIKGAFVGKN